ncbi:ABC transporter substrate-binding protein [Naasia lichenicola]|uniref:Extracellular solute-binding protein n=1 Tax=Naasia lichenicola TaxID=2565933 RepID=A0A4S4FN66_9MICO|nr:extracellular solute-binding protein [Naasia lichenicola]THG31654.1 extracellular solute-binding protein [Naasia lichenicola]
MSQHSRTLRRGIKPAAIALLAASAVVLAGCSSTPAAAPTQNTDTKEFTLYAPVTESGESPYKALADAFMKANPDYKVTLDEAGGDSYGQGLTTKLQAGNAADVFEVQPGRGQLYSILTLAEGGYLLPLDDTDAKTTIPTGAEGQFTVDDKVYGQSLDFATAGLVANLALMQKDGIAEFPTTYDELIKDCGIAKDKGHSFFVIAASVVPNAGFFSLVFSGDTVYGPTPDWNEQREADKVTFADDKGWQEALGRFTELQDAGCFQESPEAGTFDTITNALVGETSYAGAIPSGAAFGLGGANPNANFVVEPFPAPKASDTIISASVNYALAINAKSPNQVAAKKFLEYATSSEGATVYPSVSGNLPAVGADFTKLPPQFAGVATLLQDGKTYPLPNSSWDSAEVYNALGTGVQGLFTKQATVKDVLEAMDAAW